MNIKLKIITTLLGVFFGCGIVTSQTPKAEQAMDSKRQHITEVAALTGKGDLDKLKTVLIDGLNDGMAVSELKEVMVHAYAYCGFPRALRGLQTLVAVLDERKAKGIEDDWGRKASPIPIPAANTSADATFLLRSQVFQRMHRKLIMLYWLRKSKYSLKSTSSPTFSNGTC